VQAEGGRQAHTHSEDRPVAVDVTAFWRSHLRACPTTHYHGIAGKALPAIPVVLVARIGSVGPQRLALPLACVRADLAGARGGPAVRGRGGAGARSRLRGGALLGGGRDPLRGAGGEERNLPVAAPLPYGGRGRPPTCGALVRPLPRAYQRRPVAAAPPARTATWHEGDALLRAEVWDGLVREDAVAGSATFTAIAIHDPHHQEPLLLVTPVPLAPREARDCYQDHWPVKQLPLAAKQMLGAVRQFVHTPETYQRHPD